MSLSDWFAWNDGWRPGPVLVDPTPSSPVVEVAGIEVTEGPAAELSHRLHLERAEQAALERAEAERQDELERALRALS